MKTKLSHLLLFTALTGSAVASPELFEDGITVGPTGYNAKVVPFSWDLISKSMELSAETGSVLLYSGQAGVVRGNLDGGVVAYGNPVDIVLGSDDDPVNINHGVFSVWSSNNFLGLPTAKALFSIASPSNVATFEDVDVVINDGTLTVAGSPALTQSSAPTFLGGLTPPTTSSWTNTYLTRGTVLNGAAFATDGSAASGTNAAAVGSGNYANSDYSWAGGQMSATTGFRALAHGYYASAKSVEEVVFGRFNIESTPNIPYPTSYNGHDGLFRLGNGGTTTTRSDAMTVLKCGETTLTNKAWKAAVTADPDDALEDPASATDKAGNALVVDGHTILNGKVIISVPQGDISMGIFE